MVHNLIGLQLGQSYFETLKETCIVGFKPWPNKRYVRFFSATTADNFK